MNVQDVKERAFEFFHALADGFTYSPRKNPDVIFGFLWGIPVSVFALLIHQHAAGKPFNMGEWPSIVAANPFYIWFILHPIMFAVIFGALGTMRSRRDSRIQKLLKEVEQHCTDLSAANARLTELDRLKSEFLANVTHELKSPLVAALGYTDRMLGAHLGDVNERQRKALEVSKRNLIRLRKLIDEILDFSRLEAGIAKIDLVPANLNEVIQLAIENLALRAKEKRVTITAKLPDTSAVVNGDFNKLTQVANNLLDNAVKFSKEGGEVKVELEKTGAEWHLTVTDQGCGIAADVIPKLFSRFSQADGSNSRLYDGVGLGLVVVRKIVEAHQGRVYIESTLGKGTTLHVFVPVSNELPGSAGAGCESLKESANATNPAH